MGDSERKLFFASQGFKSQEIGIAPDLETERLSKRHALIIDEDKALDANVNELDIGTRARNRAFQERLDEVWRSTEGYDARLKVEARDAVETILNMKDDYARHFQKFHTSLQDEIKSIFDKFDKISIPTEERRLDDSDKLMDVFIHTTVPENIEKQSGEVSRQLRRAYETFDIEKLKEKKRETKLVEKSSKHMQSTAQRFNDENALMSSCFFNLEDDVIQHERHASRMHLLRNDSAIAAIVNLNEVSKMEASIRQEEDVDVLDTVIETQKLLQDTVLMHFGTKPFDDEDLPVMNKLNNRMDKLRERRNSKNVAESLEEGEESKS